MISEHLLRKIKKKCMQTFLQHLRSIRCLGQMDKQMNRQMDEWTNVQMDKQTNRQTNQMPYLALASCRSQKYGKTLMILVELVKYAYWIFSNVKQFMIIDTT